MFFLSAHDFVRRSEKVLTFFIISERDRSRGRVIACGGSNSNLHGDDLSSIGLHRLSQVIWGISRPILTMARWQFPQGSETNTLYLRKVINLHRFCRVKSGDYDLKYLPFISSLESWICDGIKRDRGEPRSVTLETRNTLLGTLRKTKIPIALFLNRSVFLTT